MNNYKLDYLEQLEAESIYIMREVAAQFERPALLFSGGKDSITLVHLAIKAFAPHKIPFPLVHIDTGHNFPEALAFRDQYAKNNGAELIIRKVEDTINLKKLTEPKGKFARRDEEKARAKERFFSVRDEFGQWEPKLQRPELWNIYNGRIHKGENVRVFPISNWTELDVWNYIKKENIPLPSIYFAHNREVIEFENQLIAVSDFIRIDEDDVIVNKKVRYRTVGDMTCTAAVESSADTLDEVVNEIVATRISERGETRIDDKVTEAAMEDRKKGGYF